MVLTKSNASAALKHVVENVINANSRANGQILTVLNENGFNGILDLVTIKSDDIEELKHKMPDGTILNINKGESGLIKSFISFVRFRMSTGKPFTDDQWITITYDDFQEYRGSSDYYDIDTGVVVIPPAPGTKATNTNTTSRDTRKYRGGRNYTDINTGIVRIAPPPIGDHCNAITAEEFDTYQTSPEVHDLNYNLGVGTVGAPVASNSATASDEIRATNGSPVDERRDEQAFPTLKDEKQLETSWHRSNMVQTRSQAVENVLDPSFTTDSDKEEKKLMASSYESQFVNAEVCRMQRQPERAACNLDIITSKLERYDIDSTIEVLQDGIYDINNTPLEVLQASDAHSRVPGSNMSKDTKQLWNTLFDDMSKGNWECLDSITRQLLDMIFDDATVEGLVTTDCPAFRSARPVGNFPTGRPTPRPPRSAATTQFAATDVKQLRIDEISWKFVAVHRRAPSKALINPNERRNLLIDPLGGEIKPIIKSIKSRFGNEEIKTTPHSSGNEEGAWKGSAHGSVRITTLTSDIHTVMFIEHFSTVDDFVRVNPKDCNLRMDLLGGEIDSIIKSRFDQFDKGETKMTPHSSGNGETNEETSYVPKTNVFETDDIIGHTFLLEHEEILRCKNDASKHIENVTEEHGESVAWKSNCCGDEAFVITMHGDSLRRNHLNWKKDSDCNFMIEWETGEITDELLSTVATNDPATCALCGNDNDLLELKGWKWFKLIGKWQLKSLTHVQYASLIISATRDYDLQFDVVNKGRGTQRPEKRAVYNHDLDTNGPNDNDAVYDIDSSLDDLEAYAAHSSSRGSVEWNEILANAHARVAGSTMSRDQWNSINPAAQKVWDTLEPEMKAIILDRPPVETAPRPAFRPVRPGGKHSSGRPPSRFPRPISGNLHEVSAFEYIEAQLHQMEVGSNRNDNATDDNTTLLAHATNQSTLSPSDIRAIMSSNVTRPPKRNTIASSEDTKYRQCNVLENMASNHRRSHVSSLVDRGANGGIAGEDIRVINKTTKESVNTRGINNHQITGIPIVTAGGVTMTQRGEVIVNGETLSHYVDAKFFFHHDLRTCRSVTGIRHFVNKTSSDWYSKKQDHTALSLQMVRKAAASKIIGFHHIPGESRNPADFLSKHWGYQQAWKLLKPVLFWQGDTMDVLKLDDKNNKNGNEKWQG